MSEQQRTVVLHIGMSKAGSSALQRGLQINRDRLRERGVDVPQPSHRGLLPAFGLPADPGPDAGLSMTDLITTLRETTADYIVISCESLATPRIRPTAVREFGMALRMLGWRLIVTAYVRPQPSRINAAYVQTIQGLWRPDLTDFATFLPLQRTSRIYDPLVVFRPWLRARVAFVPLPYVGGNSNMALDMLTAAGLPAERLRDLQAPGLVNQSIGPVAIAALRYSVPAFREAGLPLRDPRFRRTVHHALHAQGWDNERFTGLDQRSADDVRERFRAANEAFAARFWGRSWDQVFADEAARQWTPNEIDLSVLSPAIADRFRHFRHEAIAALMALQKRLARHETAQLPRMQT